MRGWTMSWSTPEDLSSDDHRLVGDTGPVLVPAGHVRVALMTITGSSSWPREPLWVCWDDATTTVRTQTGALLWLQSADVVAHRVADEVLVRHDGLFPRDDRTRDCLAVRCVEDLMETMNADELYDVRGDTARLRGREDGTLGQVTIDLSHAVVLVAEGETRGDPWRLNTRAHALIAERAELLRLGDTTPPLVQAPEADG